MTRREQQIAVAAAEQEQALVAMGVMEPHEFEFHPGGEEEPFAMEAADEAARAARRAELAPPTAGYDHYGDGSAKSSGSVVGGTASTKSSAGASLDRAAWATAVMRLARTYVDTWRFQGHQSICARSLVCQSASFGAT